eukprot:6658097-Prymnesium_polylepis.2
MQQLADSRAIADRCRHLGQQRRKRARQVAAEPQVLLKAVWRELARRAVALRGGRCSSQWPCAAGVRRRKGSAARADTPEQLRLKAGAHAVRVKDGSPRSCASSGAAG